MTIRSMFILWKIILHYPFFAFRWKFLGAVAWRLPLKATLLLWPKTITTFWFSILSTCLNAQLQLSRPKYLRARLKGDVIFVFPKFLIPVSKKKSRQINARENPPPLLKCQNASKKYHLERKIYTLTRKKERKILRIQKFKKSKSFVMFY